MLRPDIAVHRFEERVQCQRKERQLFDLPRHRDEIRDPVDRRDDQRECADQLLHGALICLQMCRAGPMGRASGPAHTQR